MMWITLDEAAVEDHLAAFPTPQCWIVTAAMLAGNTGGRLWGEAAVRGRGCAAAVGPGQ